LYGSDWQGYVRFWQILLQKSAMTRALRLARIS
jgi:hypothetical protein